jgi:hypothetical protein
MPVRSIKKDDPLEDFAHCEIALDDVAKRVYVAGRGPAVIVMTEMPGISPQVARFARWVRDAGFSVYMPSESDGKWQAVIAETLGLQACPQLIHEAASL